MPAFRQMILSGVLAVCLFGTGCGGATVPGPKWPEPVKVSGKVTRQGKPLENAQVIFVPEGTTLGPGGGGQTNPAGEYTAQMRWSDQKMRDGLIPGRYKVAFSRFIKPDGSVWIPSPNATEGPATSGAREELPMEISSPVESKTSIEVTAGKSTYDLDIP